MKSSSCPTTPVHHHHHHHRHEATVLEDLWQSFCVLAIILLVPVCIFINIFMVCNGLTRWIYVFGYAAWAGYDRFKAKKGGKIWWCERMGHHPRFMDAIFKTVREYFGAEVIFVERAAVERISGPIIYGCHPHGIFGISSLINFGFGSFVGGGMNAEGVKWKPTHILTLSMSFWIPLWRDVLMRFGLGPVDKETCYGVLLEKKESIAVVVGGAREAMFSSPGRYELVFKRRLGIFKIAVRSGCPIVPTFAFGEVDLYDQISLPWPLNRLQTASIHLFGFSMPILRGRFGSILPYRKKLMTVIGVPIDPVDFKEGTETDRALALQAVYLKQLLSIFDKYSQDFYSASGSGADELPTLTIR